MANEAVAKSKTQKHTVRLNGKTAGKTLVFRAKQADGGKASSWSMYSERDPKTKKLAVQKRGASATHATFDEAKAAAEAGALAASKIGWVMAKRSTGRVDSFDLANLPKA